MQTNFSPRQLEDPHIAEADGILRKCVHCGFCTATCPTYVLLGDELDSPRGRIYLIKDMLENDRPASPEVVKHIDRCLSCLACVSTCPASVDYMHLIDRARAHIEATYRRPLAERLLRGLLARVLPHTGRFRAALLLGRLARVMKPLMFLVPGSRAFVPIFDLLPKGRAVAAENKGTGVFPGRGPHPRRVALLPGCVQPALYPGINDATIRLLNRLGLEVVVPDGLGCCGALVHHMGREGEALETAAAAVDRWTDEIKARDIDAIIVNASGCGTMVKDYGHLLRLDPEHAGRAARIAALAKDVSEYLEEHIDAFEAERCPAPEAVVAYHSACSMQHGQGIRTEPVRLLRAAGFTVREIPEGHLCCGSAGTYNILQSDIARRLRARKIANIESVEPDFIATGNVGCMAQIASGSDIPVVHTVELLDWASGGPVPPALAGWAARRPRRRVGERAGAA